MVMTVFILGILHGTVKEYKSYTITYFPVTTDIREKINVVQSLTEKLQGLRV